MKRERKTPYRVLNLIHVGSKALAAIGLFGILIPGLLYGLGWLLDAANLPSGFVRPWITASLVVGGALLGLFILLLVIEQIQDAALYQIYRKGKGKRLLLADGRFECPFCGCRTLRYFEHTCPVCGKVLE